MTVFRIPADQAGLTLQPRKSRSARHQPHPNPDITAALAVFDFDESKHPRDAHGRFTDGLTSEGLPPGWTSSWTTNREKYVKGWMAAGMSRQEAEDQVKYGVGHGSGRLGRSIDEKFTEYHYGTPGNETTVGFAQDAKIGPDQQIAFIRTVQALRDSNPSGMGLAVSVVPKDQMTTQGALGEMLGNGHRIEISARAFEPFPTSTDNSAYSSVRPGTRTDEYVMTHEYGHVVEAARVASEVNDRGQGAHARNDILQSRPPPSLYGDPYRSSPQETYAEAFAQFRLSDHPVYMAANLARLDGWK